MVRTPYAVRGLNPCPIGRYTGCVSDSLPTEPHRQSLYIETDSDPNCYVNLSSIC